MFVPREERRGMMLMPNPDPNFELSSSRSFLRAARQVCQEWEKLRILYNAALVCWVVYLVNVSQPSLFQSFGFWVTCAMGAVVANVCYFAGPLAETYLNWIDFRHRSIRWALLLIGTQFTALLAGGVLLGMQ